MKKAHHLVGKFMQCFVSSTEQKKWRTFRARCSELVETFTFLKYKYGENIVLNVEIGEFSICGYVGDNLEC